MHIKALVLPPVRVWLWPALSPVVRFESPAQNAPQLVIPVARAERDACCGRSVGGVGAGIRPPRRPV